VASASGSCTHVPWPGPHVGVLAHSVFSLVRASTTDGGGPQAVVMSANVGSSNAARPILITRGAYYVAPGVDGSCEGRLEMPTPTLREVVASPRCHPRPRVLKIIGWLVIVGGTLTSVAVYWIQPMNPSLWMAMAISVAVSLAVGAVVLWVAGRWAKQSGRGNKEWPTNRP
jgi:hypothetical protein